MSIENGKISVWRYLSFSKFAWTVQKKSLWLCRADLLGDPWEISLSGKQLQLVINRHPIGEWKESAEERAARIIDSWRNRTFISCWNKSQHESNALWKIYCRDKDGVVIQTTYDKLELIKGICSLYPVSYQLPGANEKTPNHADLVTKKRPMFTYEEEVRIVQYDENNEMGSIKGAPLMFDFENLIESVRVHPEANQSVFDAVQNLVRTYAPKFSGEVIWSDMKLGSPF